MAGVYGGFTSAEFIDGAQRDFIPFHIVYAFLKNFNDATGNHTFFPWLLHERWCSRSG
jgi:hypothetical protein